MLTLNLKFKRSKATSRSKRNDGTDEIFYGLNPKEMGSISNPDKFYSLTPTRKP